MAMISGKTWVAVFFGISLAGLAHGVAPAAQEPLQLRMVQQVSAMGDKARDEALAALDQLYAQQGEELPLRPDADVEAEEDLAIHDEEDALPWLPAAIARRAATPIDI